MPRYHPLPGAHQETAPDLDAGPEQNLSSRGGKKSKSGALAKAKAKSADRPKKTGGYERKSDAGREQRAKDVQSETSGMKPDRTLVALDHLKDNFRSAADPDVSSDQRIATRRLKPRYLARSESVLPPDVARRGPLDRFQALLRSRPGITALIAFSLGLVSMTLLSTSKKAKRSI